MKRIAYQCTLLTDLVMTSTPATEGFHRSLNYIPGAKFLGMVAKSLYKMKQPKSTLDIFHNGHVQFGDAHPYVNGERLNVLPLSWMFKKEAERDEPRHIHLSYTPPCNGTEQERNAYFTKDYEWVEIQENFNIKSAYNSNQYRAQDEQMYGYFALPRDTTWCFYIDYKEAAYIEKIEKVLLGKRRIGKSKTAEYGMIDIKVIKEVIQEKQTTEKGWVYLYAASNWCFYDDFGQCTLQPTPEQLGLPKGAMIHWDKSAIRSRKYRTWNQKRRNRDADRLIIQRGSLIVARIEQSEHTYDWKSGIGAHRAEGFGQVLVNPDFLPQEQSVHPNVLKKYNGDIQQPASENVLLYQAEETDDVVLNFLQYRQTLTHTKSELERKVDEFIEAHPTRYDDISSSQWGQIRKYARLSGTIPILKQFLFDKDKGFLQTGQSAQLWRKNGRLTELEKFLFPKDGLLFSKEKDTILFMQKLAAEMAKATQNKTTS